jgi:hypothetical protein
VFGKATNYKSITMGLSLNPADVWKMFSDRRSRDKEKVAAWLDEVAAQAASLARVWEAYVAALEGVDENFLNGQRLSLRLANLPMLHTIINSRRSIMTRHALSVAE